MKNCTKKQHFAAQIYIRPQTIYLTIFSVKILRYWITNKNSTKYTK